MKIVIFRTLIGAFLFLVTSVTCAGSKNHNEDSQDKKAPPLHVPSPDWRKQIVYLTMIDRFNDGDPKNNDQGSGEYNPSLSSHFSGGDIPGIIEKLDYIKGLGITTLWTTPPYKSQWWSSNAQYGGYHGYWPLHFNEVDEHFGTLEDYKSLSKELHARDMYLMHDMIVNHVGNFFYYDGEYDPIDTSIGFTFSEKDHPTQSAPLQPPFHQIDRNNETHFQADIFNWAPAILDYTDKSVQFNHSLANLADINTTNPTVLEAFKEIFSKWMVETGIDAFRIDTVRYVEPEFFQKLFWDENGLKAKAKSLGKDNFYTLGEVLDTSDMYKTQGETELLKYLSDEDSMNLDGVFNFPLNVELRRVLGEGKPTSALAFRLEKQMEMYSDPYLLANFVDNHDVPRFLSASSPESLKQALALIFTIPGIPVIYQGTEQLMRNTRDAMFEGGYNGANKFDTSAEFYKYINRLATLRKHHEALTLGDLNILQSNDKGAGIFAFSRTWQGKTLITFFNTAEHKVLSSNINLTELLNNNLSSFELNTLFSVGTQSELMLNNANINVILPSRGILVAELNYIDMPKNADQHHELSLSVNKTDAAQKTFEIIGNSSTGAKDILLIKNGKVDSPIRIKPDQNGYFSLDYEAVNLGEEIVSFLAFFPEKRLVSNEVDFKTVVAKPQISLQSSDSLNDDKGRENNLAAPDHADSLGQMDIVSAKVEASGSNMVLTLKMKHVSDRWIPPNGFDNVAFNIFFDTNKNSGTRVLPELKAKAPDGLHWDIAHSVFGWGNQVFSSEGAETNKKGKRFGTAPEVVVDKANSTIQFRYTGDSYQIDSWQGVTMYITTWDKTGEGAYREIGPDGGSWVFKGPNKNAEKILDDLLVKF